MQDDGTKARNWSWMCATTGLALALGAGSASASDVLSATMHGSLSVGGGTYDPGPGPNYGINFHSDDPNPQLGVHGSFVAPLTPTGYDFAAPGNAHSVVAGIPDWGGATAGLTADIAPVGSGVSGLAINHLQVDLWVADNPDGLGKGASASFNLSSLLTKPKDPSRVYGALHWELASIPNQTYSPNATISMDLRLWEQCPPTAAR